VRSTTTTHEWMGSNPTIADMKEFLEAVSHLDDSTRVQVTGSDSQMDGNMVKFKVTETRAGH